MGLDMYAFSVPMENAKNDFSFESAKGEQTEIFYWRKHHDLHGWMENLYCSKGGTEEVFNVIPVRLTEQALDLLEQTIKRRELPHTTGFFFGNFPPDDESDARDFEFITKAREEIAKGNAVYYYSWW